MDTILQSACLLHWPFCIPRDTRSIHDMQGQHQVTCMTCTATRAAGFASSIRGRAWLLVFALAVRAGTSVTEPCAHGAVDHAAPVHALLLRCTATSHLRGGSGSGSGVGSDKEGASSRGGRWGRRAQATDDTGTAPASNGSEARPNPGRMSSPDPPDVARIPLSPSRLNVIRCLLPPAACLFLHCVPAPVQLICVTARRHLAACFPLPLPTVSFPDAPSFASQRGCGEVTDGCE